jgi:NADH:ubiquinone oxidoreductase subunit C
MARQIDLVIPNGTASPLSALPMLSFRAFSDYVIHSVADGAEIAALFARPDPGASGAGTSGAGTSKTGASLSGSRFLVYAVLADFHAGALRAVSARIEGSWPSLTPECPSAHWFEREIAEQWNLTPEGHPWLKPIRFQPPMDGALPGRASPAAGDARFFRVEGEEVHEVAVGPVHAGVIEPGHFRFQCHGETVLHLEISLG